MKLSRLPAPPLILGLFLGDFVFAVVYWINELAGSPREGFSSFIDLDGEANLPTWWSSMQMMMAALLTATFARRYIKPSDIKSWLLALPPLTLIAMSCDEVAQIHERIGGHSDALLPGGSRANTVFVHTGIWMFIIGIPFIIYMTGLMWYLRSYFRVAPGSLRRYAIGMTVFLFGALVMDGLGNLWDRPSFGYSMEVLIEETCENVGMTIIIWSGMMMVAATAAAGSVLDSVTEGVLLGMAGKRNDGDLPSKLVG
jgi:hypothetical protein